MRHAAAHDVATFDGWGQVHNSRTQLATGVTLTFEAAKSNLRHVHLPPLTLPTNLTYSYARYPIYITISISCLAEAVLDANYRVAWRLQSIADFYCNFDCQLPTAAFVFVCAFFCHFPFGHANFSRRLLIGNGSQYQKKRREKHKKYNHKNGQHETRDLLCAQQLSAWAAQSSRPEKNILSLPPTTVPTATSTPAPASLLSSQSQTQSQARAGATVLALFAYQRSSAVGTFRSLAWRDCCCCRCCYCCWRVANSNIQVFIVLYIRLPWPIQKYVCVYMCILDVIECESKRVPRNITKGQQASDTIMPRQQMWP